jgi:hypothetical protein
MRILLAVALLLSSANVFAADSLNDTIEKLLKAVETSDAIFIRNGDEHTGKAAAEHMRTKWEHFKKKIKTPEDFIEKCATKSELSDKPYKIKTADGKIVESKDWMMARLEAIRKRP